MPMQNRDTVNLPLDQIKIPPKEKMPRKITGIDPKVIERYAELMRDGYKGFPPIEVWQKVSHNGGSDWWIVSGIHRYKAALTAGKEIFPCKIRKFPERKFLLRAYIANLQHGVRYKRGENRLVVQQLYQEGLTIKEISNDTKIPERTLRRWVKPFADEKRGERETRVRDLRDHGLTQKEIAENLGTSQRWVSEILQWIPMAQYTQNKKDIPNTQTDPVMETTGPPGHIPQGENSGFNGVIPTEVIDKIKVKADRKFVQPKLRRHLKEAPVEDIRMVYSDTKILRRWRAQVKRGAYGKVTLSLMQKCSGTIIRASNELLLAIRNFMERLEQEPRPAAAGMAEDYREEIQVAVEKFLARNRSKIQWMPEEDREDLKMECWLAALEARQKWDATRSSLETWISNNLDWNFKDLAKKEHKRTQTMAEYRKHVQSLTTTF